jgi:formiminotetrahydrofolate cyclodeaminase
MSSFSSLSVSQFLDALASAEPTPGGGTASAVAGAMGAALLVMVAGLPKTRTNTDESRAALDGVRAELLPLRASLEVCADRDAEAFDAVMAAYRLPKATDEDKAPRKAAIARAMQGATEVPLQTLRLACRALGLGETVAQHGNVSAASDVGVAASLLYAASEGAAANVRINLGAWSEEKFRTETAAEADALSAQAAAILARIRTALAG